MEIDTLMKALKLLYFKNHSASQENPFHPLHMRVTNESSRLSQKARDNDCNFQ